MTDWTSESLWGIRTSQEIPTSIETLRGRRARSLSQIARPDQLLPSVAQATPGTVRTIARDAERFARQIRAVQVQQARMLQARARLGQQVQQNRIIQAARAAQADERRQMVARARTALGRQRRHSLAARRPGQAKEVGT